MNTNTTKKFDFISTFTGKEMHFMDTTPEEICIDDITQALSNLCRYSGHVNRFYSVAEHCVILAQKVLLDTGDSREALIALMHDATEAYLVDVPRPIKPYLIGYEEIESNLYKVISDKYNLGEISDYIHYLDTNIVRNEAEVLFKTIPDWVQYYIKLDGICIRNWSPERAKAEFLFMFNKLYSEA